MAVEKATIKCESIFSDDSVHRYVMTKVWDKSLPLANVITISPSEDYNITSDLTTTVICNNVHLLGMGGVILTNLMSKIGTDVKKIKNTSGLWNTETDKFIIESAQKADKIIIAWGKFTEIRKTFAQRESDVLTILKPYKEKVYQITDGSKRDLLHPLTPAVRKGFTLKKYSFW